MEIHLPHLANLDFRTMRMRWDSERIPKSPLPLPEICLRIEVIARIEAVSSPTVSEGLRPVVDV
jgi:hypothetical protein